MQDDLSGKLAGISSFTGQTINELRDTIWAMNKNSITFEDLQSRISNFIDKARATSSNVQFEFMISSEVDVEHTFTSVAGMNIYRVIQEAVNNAIKYAEASSITVDVSEVQKQFRIEIKDDGEGFNINGIEFGNGLNNMKKRAKDINAKFQVNTSEGEGTQIVLSVHKE